MNLAVLKAAWVDVTPAESNRFDEVLAKKGKDGPAAPRFEVSQKGDPAISKLASPDAPPEAAPTKLAYPSPVAEPTEDGADGMRFDFSSGCRVLLRDNGRPRQVLL
jgi:hypothetical protein